MGKRIISQARGKGSLTYQARKKAFIYRVGYPMGTGDAHVIGLLHSAAHSAPLLKIKIGKEIFYNPAFNGAMLDQSVSIGDIIKDGNIVMLKLIPAGTHIYNLERNPGDGGKMVRTAGNSAIVHKHYEFDKVGVTMPNKMEVILDGHCRATIGIIAGDGRQQKPFITAGKMFYKKKAKNKMWPRTSAVKMNAVDHPFGSGRGKRIKSKIAKRNAPPGRRVGHLRPRRTGKRK